MKIVQLPDVLHNYLIHLIETPPARGIHPEEGLALNRLWEAAKNRVVTIPDTELEKMTEAGAPEPDAPRVAKQFLSPDDTPAIRPECDACFADENSLTCVRPTHPKFRSEK